jgi:hypothetical protein
MAAQPQSIPIGDCVLEVGAAAGTFIGQRTDRTEPEAGHAKQLARALKTHRLGRITVAIGGVVAKGNEIAGKCEEARWLTRALATGELTVGELNAHADSLLDFFERLDKERRWEDSRELARTLSTLLALLLRWADLLRTIGVTLNIAERVRDFEIVAWARHELGTLQLSAGDLAGADRELTEAERLRRETDDHDGLAATQHNMVELCRQARARLHERQQARRAPYALVLAALVLLVLGGLAGATVGGNETTITQAATTVPPTTGHGGTTGTTGTTGTGTTATTSTEVPSKPTLTIRAPDGGTVTSSPPAIDCPPDCKHSFDKDQTVTLTASANSDHAFTRWSDTKLCPGKASCSLLMSKDREIAAVFSPLRTITVTLLPQPGRVSPSQANPAPTLRGTVTSDPSGIKCALNTADGTKCSAAFPASLGTVTLLSDPEQVNWTGGCTIVGASCQLSLDTGHTVTADFTPPVD